MDWGEAMDNGWMLGQGQSVLRVWSLVGQARSFGWPHTHEQHKLDSEVIKNKTEI